MAVKKFGWAVLAMAGVAAASVAHSAEVKLPKTLAWSAYNVGTTGYNQSVGIGKALKEAYGVSLKVVPGKNDISRMTPLRRGKVQFTANGGGTFFSFEGVFNFAAPDWGPQDVRLLASATSKANLQVATAKDAGIKNYSDLRGKRVAWVRGSPALVVGTEAMLAFGGLTWDDVVKVEFPGYGASWSGMVNGKVDAAFASTVSGPTKKLEASPRGIHWPSTPHNDAAGWKRMQAVAPYFIPHVATIGTGISADNPNEGAAYPYPILITYKGKTSDELVYSMTKAIHVQFDNYKKVEPAAAGWSEKNQTFTWAVPYHDAAIKYWQEAGLWTGAMQAHNDKLVARAGVLAAAWKKMKGMAVAEDKFQAEWMKVRAAALTAAGHNPIWK